jgi:hypothetical protein
VLVSCRLNKYTPLAALDGVNPSPKKRKRAVECTSAPSLLYDTASAPAGIVSLANGAASVVAAMPLGAVNTPVNACICAAPASTNAPPFHRLKPAVNVKPNFDPGSNGAGLVAASYPYP